MKIGDLGPFFDVGVLRVSWVVKGVWVKKEGLKNGEKNG